VKGRDLSVKLCSTFADVSPEPTVHVITITIVILAEARAQRVFLWKDLETLDEGDEAYWS